MNCQNHALGHESDCTGADCGRETTRGESYHTGYEANQQGEARDANPYPTGTWDANEWFAGWDEAA